MSHDDPKEYNLSVSTNNVHTAIAQTASALYSLVEEALQTHEGHEAEECEFELFARDILAVLARHADQMAEHESSWTDDPDEADPDELAED
jgi:D-serine deaminase-like pyridoxal phosphate-dependent protein